jgi:hypothetical protein
MPELDWAVQSGGSAGQRGEGALLRAVSQGKQLRGSRQA